MQGIARWVRASRVFYPCGASKFSQKERRIPPVNTTLKLTPTPHKGNQTY